MRRGFTLIELMVSFGVSVMFIGTIYFVHYGILHTWHRGQEKETLNEIGNVTLERIVRELRQCQSVMAIGPSEIQFQKYHVGSAPEEEAHEYTGEKPLLDTIRYGLVKGEGFMTLERTLNLDKPTQVFRLPKCDPEIFTGWVMEDCDPEKKECPRYHAFDFSQQVGSEAERIVLVAIQLKISELDDTFTIRTKVSLPAVQARLLQPGWNIGTP